MPEGTKFLDAVTNASPYKHAVSPRKDIHKQVDTCSLQYMTSRSCDSHVAVMWQSCDSHVMDHVTDHVIVV